MGSLKDYFRPEFLNRLDEIILFNILAPEAVRDIVVMQVELVKKRLAEKDIALTVSEEVLAYLAKEGYNPQYGARPLKRLIQNKILTPLASLMISQGVLEGGSVSVGLGRDAAFTFDVKKSPRAKTRARKEAEPAAV